MLLDTEDVPVTLNRAIVATLSGTEQGQDRVSCKGTKYLSSVTWPQEMPKSTPTTSTTAQQMPGIGSEHILAVISEY